MPNYKAEITLNERDSMLDMLETEKNLSKVYATALTEGATKGYRERLKSNLNEELNDQLHLFLLMCEEGYYKVNTAPYEQVEEKRETFSQKEKELN